MLPSGPLPPQNLSLSRVTPNSALITWSRHPRHVSDGFVVNVTRGLNTRSRFLPNGRVGSYTLRELTPGQHYYVALTSVKNTGQEQIHSMPQHLAFTTCELCAVTSIFFIYFFQIWNPTFPNPEMFFFCPCSANASQTGKERKTSRDKTRYPISASGRGRHSRRRKLRGTSQVHVACQLLL